MLSYKPYVTTREDKRRVKYTLLDSIKEVIGDKWTRFKEGTRQTFDMICFLGAELGFFYAGDDYFADRHEISSKTVRNRLKELVELGQAIKVYRRSKRCNGRGKPIYLFVNHPYFTCWTELLGLDSSDFHTDFHTENSGIPYESKGEDREKKSTYYLPKKQESNIYKEFNKIMQIVGYRILDSLKKGTRVAHPSSYADRTVRSLENTMYYEDDIRPFQKRKEEELKHRLKSQSQIKRPDYNWLDVGV